MQRYASRYQCCEEGLNLALCKRCSLLPLSLVRNVSNGSWLRGLFRAALT